MECLFHLVICVIDAPLRICKGRENDAGNELSVMHRHTHTQIYAKHTYTSKKCLQINLNFIIDELSSKKFDLRKQQHVCVRVSGE